MRSAAARWMKIVEAGQAETTVADPVMTPTLLVTVVEITQENRKALTRKRSKYVAHHGCSIDAQ